MPPASDFVLRFLRSIGRPAEADLYLKLFRAEAPERFALIAVDSELVGVALEALVLDLRFLAELDLAPVIALETTAEAERLRAALAPSVRAVVVPPEGAALVARAGGLALVQLDEPDAARDPLAELATALGTRKIVLLGAGPGLEQAGEIVSLVDLATEDAAGLGLDADDAALLARVRRLVDGVPHPLAVAVTSPMDLMRELFTVRGAGTLIRRGATVVRHDGLVGVDRVRLAALIETSFGRPLRAGTLDRPIDATYIADDYRGAAIVTPAAPAPYLSKFAVDARARGEGLGRDLWRALCRDHTAFFWRSRGDNPITPWYQQQCDGMARAGAWHIFWRGLPDDAIGRAIASARAAPVDLGD
jgi:acetylglutamate kinase